MSESLPSIGAHCAAPSCNVNDFLPIRCKCEKLFCKDHILPENHDCSVNQITNTLTGTHANLKLQRCAAERCDKPSLEAFVADSADVTNRTPATCPGCKQSFCATHREAASHSCSGEHIPRPEVKNQTAHDLLAKNFSSSQNSGDKSKSVAARPSKAPSNPRKAAQLRQVELMKMRHHAQPGDPKDRVKEVPLDERLHVIVRYEDSALASNQTLWFRKSIGTGRAMDLLATLFKVTASDSSPLRLSKVSVMEDDQILLRTDIPLSEQVEDGSHILLHR